MLPLPRRSVAAAAHLAEQAAAGWHATRGAQQHISHSMQQQAAAPKNIVSLKKWTRKRRQPLSECLLC